jgi:dihydrofolate reductase
VLVSACAQGSCSNSHDDWTTMLRSIAALDAKRGLATDTGIPWDVPADRQYFRRTTSGATVLMGYRTYEEFAEPMSDRKNFVATSRHTTVRPGFTTVADVGGFVRAHGDEDIWIIGGAALFTQTIELVEELYLTRIDGDFHCTKFFPVFDDRFRLTSSKQSPPVDGVPDAWFETWERIETNGSSGLSGSFG